MKIPWLPVCGLIAGLAACDGEVIVEGPDCPPPRVASAIVFGTVVDPERSPAPQADVEVIGLQDLAESRDTIGSCTGVRAFTERTTTDAAGSYRTLVSSVFVVSTCIVVEAEAGGLHGMDSGASVELRTNLGDCTPESTFDSVEVNVVLGS